MNHSRRKSYFSFFYFSEEIRFDLSCELSVKQTIHMKCQELFSLNIKKKKKKKRHFKIPSAAVVIGVLRLILFS